MGAGLPPRPLFLVNRGFPAPPGPGNVSGARADQSHFPVPGRDPDPGHVPERGPGPGGRLVGRLRATLLAVPIAAGFAIATLPARADVFASEEHAFRVVTVATGFDHPWGLAFLPDGRLLVTERSGRLRTVTAGRLDPIPIGGVPRVRASGQGGLLDIALHPGFPENGWVYLSYAAGQWQRAGTEVARGRLRGNRLEEVEVLFRALPKSGGGRHFGSRLRFAPDGHLFVTLGERGDRHRAQDPGDHAGSIVRLRDDGTVPPDNPFVGVDGARPEIYTVGNRNVQGLAFHPGTGTLFAHEHGPRGGDELNIVRAGVNYGWPVISYGREYTTGVPVGEGPRRDGMAQPVHQWTPSIAPSGLTVYDGERFPGWRGNLFVGALKFRLLARLVLDGERVIHEERLIEGRYGRVRDVRTGPDGLIYLLTDAPAPYGALLRLEPAPRP